MLKVYVIVLFEGVDGMIYAMSDIHGCFNELEENMQFVDLSGDNKIIFLGDYIDYGKQSYKVLEYIKSLQEEYGEDKVIVLKGNHEAMFLEWIDDFSGSDEFQLEALAIDSWLKTDSEQRFNTFRTFITREELEEYETFCRKASGVEMNKRAVEIINSKYADLIQWICNMPSFYETKSQVFVHAGVDEEAGEYWMWGSGDEVFLWKFPARRGGFIKTIVAGHVGTGDIAGDKHFHDIYHDGKSHYYIDGSVYKHGKLILMCYDEEEDKYYELKNGKKELVKKFEMYR